MDRVVDAADVRVDGAGLGVDEAQVGRGNGLRVEPECFWGGASAWSQNKSYSRWKMWLTLLGVFNLGLQYRLEQLRVRHGCVCT